MPEYKFEDAVRETVLQVVIHEALTNGKLRFNSKKGTFVVLPPDDTKKKAFTEFKAGKSQPEGKVRAVFKNLLAHINRNYTAIYSFWPVQTGYGDTTLDCLMSVKGQFYAIELKKPGGDLTPNQRLCVANIANSGGIVFVLGNDPEDFYNFMTMVREWVKIENG